MFYMVAKRYMSHLVSVTLQRCQPKLVPHTHYLKSTYDPYKQATWSVMMPTSYEPDRINEPKITLTLIFNAQKEKPLAELWANEDLVEALNGTEYDPKRTMLMSIHNSRLRVETTKALERLLSF